MHPIAGEVFASPQTLTPAVLQAAEMLGLYRAELARILGLQCGDIGRLSARQDYLPVDGEAGRRARDFIRLYRVLYTAFSGEEARMHHWLRVQNPLTGGVPLLQMVDEGKLAAVLATCRAQFSPD